MVHLCRKNRGLVWTPCACVQPLTVRQIGMGLLKQSGSYSTWSTLACNQHRLIRTDPTKIGYQLVVFHIYVNIFHGPFFAWSFHTDIVPL